MKSISPFYCYVDNLERARCGSSGTPVPTIMLVNGAALAEGDHT